MQDRNAGAMIRYIYKEWVARFAKEGLYLFT